MANLQVEILQGKSGRSLGKIVGLQPDSTIYDVKLKFKEQCKKVDVNRQAFRLDAASKLLKDTDTLKQLGVLQSKKLYFKDLGPQVGWATVFVTEYAGPLFIYLIFYFRPSLIYGNAAAASKPSFVTNVACAAWTGHYAKRIFETIFVHRFSHSTMPIRNIFKNSAYYWGFAAIIAYFNNHPHYTPPSFGNLQFYIGLGGFVVSELGNLSVHLALRNLRPPGSKERRIPHPDGNPFNLLFNFVSCPNYTYELGAWISYTIMTQNFTAGLFALAGMYQMTVWALGKHKNYKREFPNYPKRRTAILPFLI